MQNISMDKKYKTKSGHPVRILCIDAKNERYPVIGTILIKGVETACSFSKTGKFYSTDNSNMDLVEVLPYEDYKIDDKILVWNEGDSAYKKKRYFAGVSINGKPMAFESGKTSWSNDDRDVVMWDFCEKAD